VGTRRASERKNGVEWSGGVGGEGERSGNARLVDVCLAWAVARGARFGYESRGGRGGRKSRSGHGGGGGGSNFEMGTSQAERWGPPCDWRVGPGMGEPVVVGGKGAAGIRGLTPSRAVPFCRRRASRKKALALIGSRATRTLTCGALWARAHVGIRRVLAPLQSPARDFLTLGY
jgi:hypothetical protein